MAPGLFELMRTQIQGGNGRVWKSLGHKPGNASEAAANFEDSIQRDLALTQNIQQEALLKPMKLLWEAFLNVVLPPLQPVLINVKSLGHFYFVPLDPILVKTNAQAFNPKQPIRGPWQQQSPVGRQELDSSLKV
jgi:hypothetical protein